LERLKDLLRPEYYFARSIAHALLVPLHAVHEWLDSWFGGEIFMLLGLHAIAGAIWVGGMFFALLILRPAMRGLEPAARVALHRAVLRRFLPVVWVAMPFMLISGARILGKGYGRFDWAPWPVQAMAGLGVMMAAVFLWIWFGPYKRLRLAVGDADAAAAIGAIRWLVTVNLVLGVLATVFAGMG
jgi:uncharacterized membrane protein